MTRRLEIIADEILAVNTIADIGCDHGYLSKAILDNKKCKKVIISDISEKCLSKAENLLKNCNSGEVLSFVSNGFEKLEINDIDEALICGMGGREIINIIDSAKSLVPILVLQPMKNVVELRRFLTLKGYNFLRDFIFYDADKFYNLIVVSLKEKTDKYTEKEFLFGRDNLYPKKDTSYLKDFNKYISYEIQVANEKLENSKTEKESAKKWLDELCEVQNDIRRYL